MIQIHKVTDGLWRGPSPKAPEDWKQLRGLGVKFTLDLETGSKIFGDDSPLEEALNADSSFIRTYSHPLGEVLPPTLDELLYSLIFINGREGIYVHCKAGVDRTGMVIANYRMAKEQWPKEKAIAEMFAMGMHPWLKWWSWFL